jgi:hypothetical protein
MKKLCIIISCHLNSEKKEKKFENTIDNLKSLELPIILSSHLPVNHEIQKKIDYYIYDSRNIIFNETDFFNLQFPQNHSGFHRMSYFGGICVKNYMSKEIHWASCLNHYIRLLNYADFLGFDTVLSLEYDWSFDEKELEQLKEIINKIQKEDYDGFFIPCTMNGLESMGAVPCIFPIRKKISYYPKKIIENPEEFLISQNLNILEIEDRKFFETLDKTIKMTWDDFIVNFENSSNSTEFSGNTSFTFTWSSSGIYINDLDTYHWMIIFENTTQNNIFYCVDITHKDILISSHRQTHGPNSWFYVSLDRELIESIITSGDKIEVIEILSDDNISKEFTFYIDKNNIQNIKKLKSFSINQ